MLGSFPVQCMVSDDWIPVCLVCAAMLTVRKLQQTIGEGHTCRLCHRCSVSHKIWLKNSAWTKEESIKFWSGAKSQSRPMKFVFGSFAPWRKSIFSCLMNRICSVFWQLVSTQAVRHKDIKYEHLINDQTDFFRQSLGNRPDSTQAPCLHTLMYASLSLLSLYGLQPNAILVH